jgi:hypothetical protein
MHSLFIETTFVLLFLEESQVDYGAFFLLLKVAISLSDVEGITLQHIFVHAKSSKRSHKGQNLFFA